METVWICTVPNEANSSAKASLESIKRATSDATKTFDFYPLDIPELAHGTLDSLIALSDELHKLGPSVENMVKKVERQYFDIQEAAGKKASPLKVQEKTVDAYLHHWEWDFARYQHQGKKLGDIVNQIAAQSSTADEELKKMLAVHADKGATLAAWQRKKTVNLGTSDFEDFLTAEQVKGTEVLDNDHLLTLMVSMPKHSEADFLDNYCGSDSNSGGWKSLQSIASYGAASDRDSLKGSPVVPGSAKLVVEVDGQVMYAVTILRGHTLPGRMDDCTSVFTPGAAVDYVEPTKKAFKEYRITARVFSMHADERSLGVDGQVAKAQAEWNTSASTIARWNAAHFGDILSAFMHLKVIAAYVESVLRYGVPVDLCSTIVIPLPACSVEALATLTDAVMDVRPQLAHDAVLEEEDDDDGHLAYVLQTFSVCRGVGEIAAA